MCTFRNAGAAPSLGRQAHRRTSLSAHDRQAPVSGGKAAANTLLGDAPGATPSAQREPNRCERFLLQFRQVRSSLGESRHHGLSLNVKLFPGRKPKESSA